MLVESPGDPLAVDGVVVEVVLESLRIPLFVVDIVEFLNAEILGSLEPVGEQDSTAVSRVAAEAAVLFGGEVEISLALIRNSVPPTMKWLQGVLENFSTVPQYLSPLPSSLVTSSSLLVKS